MAQFDIFKSCPNCGSSQEKIALEALADEQRISERSGHNTRGSVHEIQTHSSARARKALALRPSVPKRAERGFGLAVLFAVVCFSSLFSAIGVLLRAMQQYGWNAARVLQDLIELPQQLSKMWSQQNGGMIVSLVVGILLLMCLSPVWAVVTVSNIVPTSRFNKSAASAWQHEMQEFQDRLVLRKLNL